MGTLTASFVICLASMTSNPVEDLAVDRVDLIEVNHFYDEKGRLVFDQIIFYDWSATRSRYNIRDWRLLKTRAQLPRRDSQNQCFVAVWHDGNILRQVTANSCRESWTQYDPELTERQFLPKDRRPQLTKVAYKLTP
ncbi:MAG: hypothetical protein ABGX05_12380 [Pirellulaceae bacterium]